MKSTRYKHLTILSVLALMLYVVLHYSLQIKFNLHQPYYWPPDADSYLHASLNLYTNGSFDMNRPFGYPLLIGIPMLFGLQQKIAQFGHLLNIAFWLASICTIYFSVDTLLNNKWFALWGAIFFITMVGPLVINIQLLTEPACNFFMLFVGYQLAQFYSKPHPDYLAYSIISLGTGALIKPILFPLTVLAILVYFIVFMFGKKRFYVLFLLIPTVLFAVQIVGNGLQHNSFRFSNIGGYTFFNYLGAYAEVSSCSLNLNEDAARWESEKTKRILEIPKQKNGEVDWNVYQKKIQQDLYHQATENTWPLVYSFVRNLVSNATSPSGFVCNLRNLNQSAIFELLKKVICIISRLQNSMLSLIGFCGISAIFFGKRLKQKNKPAYWWLITSSIVTTYFVLISAISLAQGDRLHLPIFGLATMQLVLFYRLLCPYQKAVAKK